MRLVPSFAAKHSPPLILAVLVSLSYILLNHFFSFYLQSDGPFHLAAIRTFPFDSQMVSPILQLPDIGDYHYNLSVYLQAMLYRLSDDMHITVLLSGGLFVGLFLLSFALFASRFCRNQKEQMSALLVLLFLSGPVNIIWAGAYSFSGLMINGFYSQTFAYTLFFTTLYFSFPRVQNVKYQWLTLLLMSACLVQHLLTGMVLLFSYYLLASHRFFSGEKVMLRQVLLPFPALIFYLAWPYYPTLKLFEYAVLEVRALAPPILLCVSLLWLSGKRLNSIFDRSVPELICDPQIKNIARLLIVFILVAIVINMVFYTVAYLRMSPFLLPIHFKQHNPISSLLLLALVPTFLYLWMVRERDFIALWVPSLLFLSLLGWFLEVTLYWRLIFFCLIAVMIGIGRQIVRNRSKLHLGIALATGLIMLLLQANSLRILSQFDRYSELERVAALLPKNALILSDAKSSYRLAGLASRKVITSFASHWGSSVPGDERQRRREDVNRFFSEGVTRAERESIIDSYGTNYLLIAVLEYDIEGYRYRYSTELADQLEALATEVLYRGRDYMLLKL